MYLGNSRWVGEVFWRPRRHGSQVLAADDNFGAYCLARAKLLRSIESTKDCSRDEWGGGEHGCYNFVLARALNGRVVISTPGQPTLHVCNANFDLTDEPIAHFILRPGDIAMSHVCNGIHFSSPLRLREYAHNRRPWMPANGNEKLLYCQGAWASKYPVPSGPRDTKAFNISPIFIKLIFFYFFNLNTIKYFLFFRRIRQKKS